MSLLERVLKQDQSNIYFNSMPGEKLYISAERGSSLPQHLRFSEVQGVSDIVKADIFWKGLENGSDNRQHFEITKRNQESFYKVSATYGRGSPSGLKIVKDIGQETLEIVFVDSRSNDDYFDLIVWVKFSKSTIQGA